MRGILLAVLMTLGTTNSDAEPAPASSQVDPNEAKIRERLDELIKAMKDAKTAQAFQFSAQTLFQHSIEAEESDLYELAQKALEQAAKAAQVAKDATLAASIQDRQALIKSRSAEYARVKPAKAKLETSPDDKPSNTTVGKWLCFVKGDWEGGRGYLEKGSDEKLAKVAAREREAGAGQDVKMACSIGDDWKLLHAPRAVHWYSLVWPNLDPIQREPVRQKIKSILRRSPQAKLGDLSTGWYTKDSKLVGTDTEYARTGKLSMKVSPEGSASFKFAFSANKEYEISGWVLSDGDDGHNEFGVIIGRSGWAAKVMTPVPKDQPYWTNITKKFKTGGGDTGASVHVISTSKTGAFWVDDISLREIETGSELVTDGSFEKR